MSDDTVHRGPWGQNTPTGGADQNAPTGGGVDGGNPEAHLSNMMARLARLEGEISAYKLIFALIITVLIGGFAFLGVQITRADGKLSAVASDVQSLPEKISGNLLAINRTLSDAITATKQTPPQIILMPSPLTVQAPQSPPPSMKFDNKP
jgi:hypothetical protein